MPPSVNSWLGLNRRTGTIYKKPAAVEWAKDAFFIAQAWRKQVGWRPTFGKKVVADWWVYWPDQGTHDPNNLEKVMWDALEGVIYDNDKWVLPRCQDFDVDVKNPRVEIAFWVKGA